MLFEVIPMQKKRDFRDLSRPNVLISGASFAGLSTAFWMHKLGYQVSIVEIAGTLKKGGTPVDIRDRTVDIVKRMGIFDTIKSQSLPPRPTEFKAVDDTTQVILQPHTSGDDATGNGFEIERDVLLNILFEKIDGNVEMIFGNAIKTLHDGDDAIHVEFVDGSEREFSLVIGCDGNRSAT